jgi:methyl-accepting chemotaxis protein
MTWCKNLSIGTNLLAAFTIVATFTALTGIIGIRNMDRIRVMNEATLANELMGTNYIKQANIDLLLAVRDQKNFLMAQNDDQRQEYLNNMDKSKSLLRDDLKKAAPLFYREKGKELLREANAAITEWDKVDQKVGKLGLSGNTRNEAILLSVGKARERINEVNSLIVELSKMKEVLAREASDETSRIYKRSSLLMISLAAASLLLAWPWVYLSRERETQGRKSLSCKVKTTL